MASESRLLPLAGADNARDLGGLITRGGERVRRGRLFRAALIPELVPADVDLLMRRVGLRTVVDLRTPGEVRAVPGSWHEHEIRWVHCPIHLAHAEPVGTPGIDYAAGYHTYLTGDPQPALRAVRTLMDPASPPALFHCAAGKDRTGVIAALLLDVLGVAPETIAQDYALTLDALPAILRRLSALAPYAALRTTTVQDHVPEAQTMLRFLRRLAEDWGGAAGWLQSHDVTPQAIGEFRARMVEPG